MLTLLILLDRRTRSAPGGRDFFSRYSLSCQHHFTPGKGSASLSVLVFAFKKSTLLQTYTYHIYRAGGRVVEIYDYSAVSCQQLINLGRASLSLSRMYKNALAVISWLWGLRIRDKYIWRATRGKKRRLLGCCLVDTISPRITDL